MEIRQADHIVLLVDFLDTIRKYDKLGLRKTTSGKDFVDTTSFQGSGALW